MPSVSWLYETATLNSSTEQLSKLLDSIQVIFIRVIAPRAQ